VLRFPYERTLQSGAKWSMFQQRELNLAKFAYGKKGSLSIAEIS